MKEASTSAKTDKILAFIKSLKNGDSSAIQKLAAKITPDVRMAVHKNRIPFEEVEELVHDAILVLISNIRKGTYKDQGYHPAAYAMAVVRNLISNKRRTQKSQHLELDDVNLVSDFDPAIFMEQKERQKLVHDLLNKLGETCRKLIQLKYFKGLKDKEIILQKLTQYSSTDSIKSKRNQCMKKLILIAKKEDLKGMV